MKDRYVPGIVSLPMPSRRRFVQGLALGGAAAALGGWAKPLWAQTAATAPLKILSGTEFDLE
ncbi:MAG: hypothetical protein C4338_06185, partial [Rhodanobacteraceae bacterium]